MKLRWFMYLEQAIFKIFKNKFGFILCEELNLRTMSQFKFEKKKKEKIVNSLIKIKLKNYLSKKKKRR